MPKQGRARIRFKVKIDVGVPAYARFREFEAEGKRLLEQMKDPNFYYDENPELLGILTWFISLGSK